MISSKNEEICAMGLSVFYSRAINFPVIKYDLSELDNMEDLMIIRQQCSQSLPLGNWETLNSEKSQKEVYLSTWLI